MTRRLTLGGLVLWLWASTACHAQSLKPDAPAPMQAGVNKGTTDNFVGAQYWYFIAGPGDVSIHVSFSSMTVMGAGQKVPLTVHLYDDSHSFSTSKVLTSDGKAADLTIPGHLTKADKIIVEIAPPKGGLVRMGGDYQLSATGAVKFGQATSGDPIVRVYKQMGGYTKILGACKFQADGSIVTASGEGGKWVLFDKDSATYTVDIDGQERKSLHYMPGRGLLDGDDIIFQEMR